jgi:uncharacterized protein (DUF302 family)
MKNFSILVLLLFSLFSYAQAAEKAANSHFDKEVAARMIDSSIQRFKIADDVSIDDAIDSMKLRANILNFKLVADLPLSDQIKAMGEESNRMQILAFCDALIAKEMVEYNIIFAGFLPCRIAAVEDKDGQGWLVTTNMDMMLHAVDLPDHLQPLAKKVRDTIYSIIDAGVNGDL